MSASGPLCGIRIVEFAGIGPAPHCAMLLSDMGAEILRIDRPDAPPAERHDVTLRGRKSLALDLKSAAGVQTCLELIERADVLIEGFRPGVMERLGLGPQPALARNPRLVYGRMTGWGQSGPLALTAGHDINYIALSGALAGIGPAVGCPVPPLNLVGDYGGGSLYLAMGILAALLERQNSGSGQVVDAAIVDGAASLMAYFSGWQAGGAPVTRGNNLLGGAAHCYRCYECADGKYLAVGPLEPKFYALLMQGLPLSPAEVPTQERADWNRGTETLAKIFLTRTRDQWCAVFAGSDACVAPVMELREAPDHPHNKAREVYVDAYGVVQPAPAPRFSRTPGRIQSPPPDGSDAGRELAASWGVLSC